MDVAITIYEIANYSTTTVKEWTFDNNISFADSDSTIMTPITLAAKYNKHHHAHIENVSPVTLSTEWSRLTRLIFLTILSVIGSIGNIAMISSVMIEDHLKKAGLCETFFLLIKFRVFLKLKFYT